MIDGEGLRPKGTGFPEAKDVGGGKSGQTTCRQQPATGTGVMNSAQVTIETAAMLHPGAPEAESIQRRDRKLREKEGTKSVSGNSAFRVYSATEI